MRLFLLFAAAALLSSCGKPSGKASAPPAVPVEVAAAEKRDMPVELHAIGTVEPLASVQLKAKVQGEIVKVLFADGAYVAAGQPLFAIDERPFQVALQRAQAALAETQAGADNAQSQADRYTKLSSQGVASREEFAQYLTAATSQKSALAARQADVDEAQLSLEWATVRAPIAGRAGAALLKAGNIVQGNTDVLTVINQTQPTHVTFSLPETQLAEVRKWMGEGAVKVVARSPSSGETLGEGWLDFVDNTVDRQSGMIAMKATFPNEKENLWPGQFVEVVVALTTEAGVVVVPSEAIMEGQAGPRVFVVKDGVAKLRPVEIERAAEGVSILGSGVEPGEEVIVTGQLRVTNGSKVAAHTPTPTPAP